MLIGITQIRGIGYAFASAILDSLKIDPHSNIGFLSDDQVKSIENIIKNPESAKFPSWFLNRRKDLPTGKDVHLITSDIEFSVRTDIEREKTANSWRGFRHTFGLKVRGQRTRTTGRKGGAVGVQKGGKVLPAGAVVPGVTAEETVPAEGAAPAEELLQLIRKVHQLIRKGLQLIRRLLYQLIRRMRVLQKKRLLKRM